MASGCGALASRRYPSKLAAIHLQFLPFTITNADAFAIARFRLQSQADLTPQCLG